MRKAFCCYKLKRILKQTFKQTPQAHTTGAADDVIYQQCLPQHSRSPSQHALGCRRSASCVRSSFFLLFYLSLLKVSLSAV